MINRNVWSVYNNVWCLSFYEHVRSALICERLYNYYIINKPPTKPDNDREDLTLFNQYRSGEVIINEPSTLIGFFVYVSRTFCVLQRQTGFDVYFYVHVSLILIGIDTGLTDSAGLTEQTVGHFYISITINKTPLVIDTLPSSSSSRDECHTAVSVRCHRQRHRPLGITIN